MSRLKRGDNDAYEELLQTYGRRLRAVIGRYLHSWDRVEDALQDVWLSVHRGIGSFNGRSALGTWLHRVAVNASLMLLRGESRRPTVRLGALAAASGRMPSLRDAATAPQDAVSDAEDVAKLRRIVSEHAAMELKVAGHPLREIARVLGVCTATVKTRLARSRSSIAHRCGLESWVRTGAQRASPGREGTARAIAQDPHGTNRAKTGSPSCATTSRACQLPAPILKDLRIQPHPLRAHSQHSGNAAHRFGSGSGRQLASARHHAC